MRTQRGYTLVGVMLAVFIVGAIGMWIWNATKLTACDFSFSEGSSYRCELVHGAGLIIPPVSYVTAWFGDDGA